MQDKITDNPSKKQELPPDAENFILGSFREGRKPGLADAEVWEDSHGIKINEFLNRVEVLQKNLKPGEFGINQKSNLEKVIFFILEAGYCRNKVLNRIEDKKGRHIQLDSLYIQLIRKNLKISKEDLRSLLASDAVESFHPFGIYLSSLEKMKFDLSINYFQKLSEYIITSNPDFFAVMLKKHLIRAIDQYFRGVPNRFIIVLFGDQDKGKSIYLKWLNPLGNEYYSEQPLRGDKDCEILLATVLIFSIEELEGLSKQEINKTKSFISRAIINERRPYGTEAIPLPRLASIFASTNDREFLTDTNNTRWIIFEIKQINYDYNNLKTSRKEIDIHSLWWQAFHEWKADNSAGMLTSDEKVIQEKTNKDYQISSPEYHLILKHLREPVEGDQPKENSGFPNSEGIEFLTSTEILIRFAGKYPQIKINATWVGREMKRAGFESSWKWINGRSIRGYLVVWMDLGNTIDKPESPF